LGVLSGVVNEVIKAVGEERSSSSNSGIDAGLTGNVQLNDLQRLGMLCNQSKEFWSLGITRSRNDEVRFVLEL